MFLKAPTPRSFHYEFKYYTPKEEDEKRIKFRRIRHSAPAKKGSILRLAILAIILALAVVYLQKRAGTSFGEKETEPGKIKVEDIIIVN